jgi:hypothetical protein
MPSSLNDACRTMEAAADEIDRFYARLGLAQSPSTTKGALDPFTVEACAKVAQEVQHRMKEECDFGAGIAAREIRALIGQPAPASNAKEAWRHKKRGTVYRVLHDNAPMQEEQTEGRRLDDEPMVVYQDIASGAVYVRPVVEFYDGRFEQVAAPAGCASKPVSSTDPATSDLPPPFEWMKLQSRRPDGGAWIDIFPSQLEECARNGYDVRAVEPVAQTERAQEK